MHFFSQNILECDLKNNIYVHPPGALALSSQDASFSTSYTLLWKNDRAIEVTNRNTKITIYVNPTRNPKTGNGEAFDLREYTKGNYYLKAYSTNEIPIITWCSKNKGGNVFRSMFSATPNFF